MEREKMRTWAEIDLGRLKQNYIALRALTPQGCQFVGVVKANAYGHGAVPVAKALESWGADYLAVACLDEAVQLRDEGIRAPILILGHTSPEYADRLLALRLTQTVGDWATAQALSQAAVNAKQKLRIHVKIDTGMSRLGFLCDEGYRGESVQAIAALCALEGLEAEGMFTHFAAADGDEGYTMDQLTRFLDVLHDLEGLGVSFKIRHCAASAAVLNYPCTHLDMVRPGIALYGHYPAPSMDHLCDLRPVMCLKTRVAAVRDLPAGAAVSYGCTHRLDRDSRLGVLPIGYGDGLHRGLSDRLTVSVNGAKATIVGRICMDLCMIDVTDLPDVQSGDEVILYGDEVPVEAAADLCGTIQYELLCAVSQRVPRIYR